jgi:Flp pilus assembly protein TadD
MSLLLDALKTAEGQARRNPAEGPARRDATLTDDQILTLAEDHVAAPAPAKPGPAASGRFRHNPAAFPPLADTMRTRVPGTASTRRWARPVGIAALVLAVAAVLWVLFRQDAGMPALVPPLQGTHAAPPAPAEPEPVTVGPAAPAATAVAGPAPVVADDTTLAPEAGSDRAASADGDAGPSADPLIASRVERAPMVITGRPSALAAAHAALRAGDLQRAESLYRQTLAAERDQPDAHLGMALIEQSRGARQAALTQYRAVLALRPGDPQAWAGLADLASDGELDAMESRLRSLVATRPDPALHFALGNILARQGRWSGAQESYFAATTGAPQNADYAFNLAVALDQIGKGSVAAAHYARALALASDSRAVQFDAGAARTRLQQLEATAP